MRIGDKPNLFFEFRVAKEQLDPTPENFPPIQRGELCVEIIRQGSPLFRAGLGPFEPLTEENQDKLLNQLQEVQIPYFVSGKDGFQLPSPL